jgi:uncharacterized protein involved in outer membrane biogenesis
MRKFQILAVTLFVTAVSAAYADVVVRVNANTSTLLGDTGSVDFQFNPGFDSQGAAVLISNFSTDGSFAGTQQDVGAATGGPITNPITISNTAADNEDFETFSFGKRLQFDLTFSGPAITAPNGTSLSTSVFNFSIFSDPAGTIPALTSNPNGIAATVTVNLDGTVSAASLSPFVAVPEPSYTWLAGSVLLLLGAWRRWRKVVL